MLCQSTCGNVDLDRLRGNRLYAELFFTNSDPKLNPSKSSQCSLLLLDRITVNNRLLGLTLSNI